MTSRQPIAIVGRGGCFPGGSRLDDFWELVRTAGDARQPVPAGRWGLSARYAVSAQESPDRVAHAWGCYITYDPPLPESWRAQYAPTQGWDPLGMLGLSAAWQAWNDVLVPPDPQRTGVILGHIVLPTEATSHITAAWRLAALHHHMAQALEGAGKSSQFRPSPWREANWWAAGWPARLIAEVYDLGGVAYTLDAACASSLYAFRLACEELWSLRADAMLAGGVSRPDCQYTQFGFSRLQALSRRGRCAPLSSAADGLMVGEGAGVFVLKRLADAVRAGDRIYGLIHAIGLSNDRGGNLLAPQTEGQLRAMQAAYAQAHWCPWDVDLLECHATGTPTGDAVELESIHRLWQSAPQRRERCVVGSVKSNIGHLLTAAGSASLMKVLLACEHQTLPPTANVSQPAQRLQDPTSPFELLHTPRPWTSPAQHPRRAAINAFGFGGINAHLLLEAWDPEHFPQQLPSSPSCQISFSENPLGQPRHPEVTALDPKFEVGPLSPEDSAQQPCAIAVVGVALRVGPWLDRAAFAQWWLGVAESQPLPRTHGLAPCEAASQVSSASQGYNCGEVDVQVGEFRIPPRELQESLPQQLLMLQQAAAALHDAGMSRSLGNRAGVFIGLELDPHTTNFHARWVVEEHLPVWLNGWGVQLTADDQQTLLHRLREGISPPLTANRVMGNLGGIVASRLAREFDVGGPAFTLSAGAVAGWQALHGAWGALQRREIDVAVVGVIDFPCDVRRKATASDLPAAQTLPCADASVVWILQRLEDAQREGRQPHAVIPPLAFDVQTVSEQPSITSDDETPVSGLQAGAAQVLLDATCQIFCFQQQVVRIHTADGGRFLPTSHQDSQPVTLMWNNGLQRYRLKLAPAARSSSSSDSRTAARGLPTSAAAGLRRCAQPVESLWCWAADSHEELQRQVRQALQALRDDESLGLQAARWSSSAKARGAYRLAAVASRPQALRTALEEWLNTPQAFDLRSVPAPLREVDLVFHTSPVPASSLAFVFPGSGCEFWGMGRELLMLWPEVRAGRLAIGDDWQAPWEPTTLWVTPGPRTHVQMLLAQVWLAITLVDWLALFHIHPHLALGHSLGESAALFALRVWNDYEEMWRRLQASTLFRTALVPPYEAVRRQWRLRPHEAVDWICALVEAEPESVRVDLEHASRCYLQIIQGPKTCVLGGERREVERVVSKWNATWMPLPWPSAVHTPLVHEVEAEYRELHRLACTAQRGVIFYRGADAVRYEPTPDTAAEAIVAQARHTLDFPRLIRQAWADGARLFLEIGPGASCTRVIPEILAGRDHWAGALCPPTTQPVRQALSILAALWVQGIAWNRQPLDRLYYATSSRAQPKRNQQTHEPCATTLRIRQILPPWPEASSFWKDLHMTKAPSDAPRATQSEGSQASPEPAQAAVATSVHPRTRWKLRASRHVWPEPSWQGVTCRSTTLCSRLQAASHSQPSSAALRSSAINVGAVSEQPPSVADAPGNGYHSPSLPQTLQAQGDMHHQILEVLGRSLQTHASAHAEYLRFTEHLVDLLGRWRTLIPAPTEHSHQVADALSRHSDGQFIPRGHPDQHQASRCCAPTDGDPQPSFSTTADEEPPRQLDYRQCLQFAVGKIGEVLGPRYAEIDTFPTRVRLPDVPLMLVDRILDVQGEPLSLQPGRVLTEHDIHPDDWYLESQRIPTCLAVESGQADLFLSGWLGIDYRTRGRAMYRLLDAVVTFHDHLPGPGSTIRYDIRITRFFRQGETHLFRFEFEGTVGGRPLLTMRDGCAGFFTPEELAAGQGIVRSALDQQPRAGMLPADWQPFVSMTCEAYTTEQLAALRAGDLVTCFGPAFAGLPLQRPHTLPTGRLNLVHRVLQLDPQGGRYGLGIIRGEADIHPEDWFLVCHFCDDRVMPGTLMYECCLHTLRIFLLRLGWIGEQDRVAYEPIPGVASRLKCRGQVTAQTKRVWYEVSIKELGYGMPQSLQNQIASSPSEDTPFCLADALMYADGKPIVEITDMSVRLTGLTRRGLEALWQAQRQKTSITSEKAVLGGSGRPPLFDRDRITEFAVGKPSRAFGEPYRIFDEQRRIARLPGPPFQFLDRIVSIANCQPWELRAGAVIEAEYDVPPDAWYFTSARHSHLPFAVLLETALQPCGWLAAYLGSALLSPVDLSFRNLGGQAILKRAVTRHSGTLHTRVELTQVARSAGMIIQHFRFAMHDAHGMVYEGTTYFGFFSAEALQHQVGLRDVHFYELSEQDRLRGHSLSVPTTPPWPDERWRMVSQIDHLMCEGGPHGVGYVRGHVPVDPQAWFFRAHFYQDPVWPGSLGLESLLQLLQVYARHCWQDQVGEYVLLPGYTHEWIYRGQILPQHGQVTVEARPVRREDGSQQVVSDGCLAVDGRMIYQMKGFVLGRAETPR
ncbi:MAG: hypothetical protein KatS3mg114_1099 [Planctomycetaceae bacterium]|nr:MAG: hypothetical protein KatS3mg114_1099 [Planctomycetaceae bacterium]